MPQHFRFRRVPHPFAHPIVWGKRCPPLSGSLTLLGPPFVMPLANADRGFVRQRPCGYQHFMWFFDVGTLSETEEVFFAIGLLWGPEPRAQAVALLASTMWMLANHVAKQENLFVQVTRFYCGQLTIYSYYCKQPYAIRITICIYMFWSVMQRVYVDKVLHSRAP